MQTLLEAFGITEDKFQNIKVKDLDCTREFDTSDDPKDWCLVRARSQDRSAPIYTDGLFKVLRCEKYDSLTEDVEVLDVDQILDRMPTKLEKNKVIPSPSGEYIDIIQIYGSENADGTINLKTKSRSQTIPVELVIEPVTYDKAVVELL